MDDSVKTTPASADTSDQEVPRSLKMLRYIEQHPGCSYYDIQTTIGIQAPAGYLKPYIAAGYLLVTKTKPDGHVEICSLQLAPGITAGELYKIRRYMKASTEAEKLQGNTPDYAVVDECHDNHPAPPIKKIDPERPRCWPIKIAPMTPLNLEAIIALLKPQQRMTFLKRDFDTVFIEIFDEEVNVSICLDPHEAEIHRALASLDFIREHMA